MGGPELCWHVQYFGWIPVPWYFEDLSASQRKMEQSLWYSPNSTWVLTTRHSQNAWAQHARLDSLDASNVESCRDMTWRAKWNFGLCRLICFDACHSKFIMYRGVIRIWMSTQQNMNSLNKFEVVEFELISVELASWLGWNCWCFYHPNCSTLPLFCFWYLPGLTGVSDKRAKMCLCACCV